MHWYRHPLLPSSKLACQHLQDLMIMLNIRVSYLKILENDYQVSMLEWRQQIKLKREQVAGGKERNDINEALHSVARRHTHSGEE